MAHFKVSVIVPCWGVERYLDRCVNSLVSQTLKDIEIILVDDESPDNCPQLCDEWALRDSRIKVIHKINAGLGFARNSGLEIARGEYVAFCDSDDYVKQDAYEQLYNTAKKYGADVVLGSFYKETAPGVWEEQRRHPRITVYDNDEVKEFLLDMIASAPYVKIERKHDMSSCMSVYRKSIIKDNNIRFLSERENSSEDTTFNIDYLKHATKIVAIPYTFYYYCLNGGSLTQTFLPEKLERLVTLRQQMIYRLEDWDPLHERINRFYIGFARSYIICLFKDGKSNRRELMKRLISNSVWDEIKNEYKASYLPFPARIIYWLTINKHLNLLIITGFCLTKLWQLKERRK